MTQTKTSVENNENKNNKENNCSSTNKKVSNALMKKTKSELLAIIFRKDDVELELNNTLKLATEDYKNLYNKYDELHNSFDALNNKYDYLLSDYSEMNDNTITIICELRNKIHKLVNIILLSFLINVIFIVEFIVRIFL